MHWKYTEATNSAFGDIEPLTNAFWSKSDYGSSGYTWLPSKKGGGETNFKILKNFFFMIKYYTNKMASLEICFKNV